MASRCLGLPATDALTRACAEQSADSRRTDAEALAMLQLVRERGYSKQGEMFDAEQLAQTVAAAYSCVAEVEEHWTVAGAVLHLLAGRVLLVPYDAAPNHEPCLQGACVGGKEKKDTQWGGMPKRREPQTEPLDTAALAATRRGRPGALGARLWHAAGA